MGEPISIAFALKDYYGEIYADAIPTLSIVEVKITPEVEKLIVRNWVAIPYNTEEGCYVIILPSSDYSPGIYNLWIGPDDGQHVRYPRGAPPVGGKMRG